MYKTPPSPLKTVSDLIDEAEYFQLDGMRSLVMERLEVRGVHSHHTCYTCARRPNASCFVVVTWFLITNKNESDCKLNTNPRAC